MVPTLVENVKLSAIVPTLVENAIMLHVQLITKKMQNIPLQSNQSLSPRVNNSEGRVSNTA